MRLQRRNGSFVGDMGEHGREKEGKGESCGLEMGRNRVHWMRPTLCRGCGQKAVWLRFNVDFTHLQSCLSRSWQ